MATKIQPGKYDAKIIDYGVKESKNGNIQILILLEYNDSEGDRHEITWFGSLKEGQARSITLETLLKCGLRGNDITLIGEGVPSGLLDVETAVTIAVIENEYEGKKSMRVQWISNAGGALGQRLPSEDAKGRLRSMNLMGDLALARQELGIQGAKPKAQAPMPSMREPGDDSFDDVFGPA